MPRLVRDLDLSSMRSVRFGLGWLVLAALGGGCNLSPLREEGAAQLPGAHDGTRLVEVYSTAPEGPAGAFVEIRNDSDEGVSLAGWALKVGSKAMPLEPRQVDGSVGKIRGVDPSLVPPHGLALVVDRAMPAAAVMAAACERGIATDPERLRPTPSKVNLIKGRRYLEASLRLQQAPNCVPVFTVQNGSNLGTGLAGARTVVLQQGSTVKDRAEGAWSDAPRGVAFERTGLDAGAFRASPLGTTPGTRNYFPSDPAQVAEGAPPPITMYSASPWRVGALVESYRAQARELNAQAQNEQDETAAQHLRDQAAEALAKVQEILCDEIRNGAEQTACEQAVEHHLPENPLAKRMTELVQSARTSVVGSFYQVEHHDVVAALAEAAGNGRDVRLTTDADFQADPGYMPGFAQILGAGGSIVFDSSYTIPTGEELSLTFRFETKDDRGTETTSDDIITKSEQTTRFTFPQLRKGQRRSLAELGAPALEPFTRLDGDELTVDLAKVFATYDGQVVADFGAANMGCTPTPQAEPGCFRGITLRSIQDSEQSPFFFTDNRGERKERPFETEVKPQGNFTADRAPLSHNKFMVVDGQWLWTGSFNAIEDHTARIHADNGLLFRSRGLAEIHEQEFETLFGGGFGILKRDEGVGGGEVWVDGAQVEVRFSPGLEPDNLERRAAELDAGGDACNALMPGGAPVIPERYRTLDPCGGPLDLIYGELARATSSIYFVAFSMALPAVVDVMIERGTAGVDLRGVVHGGEMTDIVPKTLVEQGFDIRFTPNSSPDSDITPLHIRPQNPDLVFLHHKFIVIDYGTDHPVVITGSHNMSDGAENSNDETLVVIRDRAVAEYYYRIFRETHDHPQSMVAGSREPPPRATASTPPLAITEVRASGDPAETQWVEIANFHGEPVDLGPLSLWNRRAAVELDGSNRTLAPNQRAVIVFGRAADVDAAEGALVFEVDTDRDRPFVGPATSLVLRDQQGRWVATWDPPASAETPGAVEGTDGTLEWLGFDARAIQELTANLLGTKVEGEPGARFSWEQWQPRGTYSEWLDEFDITPSTLLLQRAPTATWTRTPTGTPGR